MPTQSQPTQKHTPTPCSKIHLFGRIKVKEDRGVCFERTTFQAPFTGTFDAERIRKALQPEYGGLYRPVTIESVSLVSPGVVQWDSCFSIGD